MPVTLSSTTITMNSGSVIQDPPGTAPSYLCRAWVNFDGTGTFSPNPSTTKIRASGNVSSITDNGTGDYTVNFTTALADANYAVAGMSSADITGYGDTGAIAFRVRQSTAPTTTAVRITNGGGGGSLLDAIYANVAIFR
jgi:hypothetical protein